MFLLGGTIKLSIEKLEEEIMFPEEKQGFWYLGTRNLQEWGRTVVINWINTNSPTYHISLNNLRQLLIFEKWICLKWQYFLISQIK